MTEPSYYEVLGVESSANDEAIRKSYRKLVLRFHPDRNPDPVATDQFIRVTQAYEVLSDRARRAEYDRLQSLNEELRRSKVRPTQREPREPQPTRNESPRAEPPKQRRPPSGPLAEDLMRLSSLINRARYMEAERLAQKVMSTAPREPLPYAVLGDLSRIRGNLERAAEMYAYATQFDPSNRTYLVKHEEVLKLMQRPKVESVRNTEQAPQASSAPIAGALLTLVACGYVAIAREPAVFAWAPINTFTIGLVVMLILAGVSIGATLHFGGYLERISAHFGPSPGLLLGGIVLLNLWAAGLIYLLVTAPQKTVNPAAARLLGASMAATMFFAVAAAISGRIDALQVVLWGGNLIYLSSLVGWMGADSLLEMS